MNAIQNFAFEEHLVRVVERDGEPWFVGKDVCAVLGIAKHHQALDTLDGDERGTCSIGTPSGLSGRGGGEQNAIVVSEPGVYRLVFRSRKPEAERFKRWLAHEVLPQIRKTGRYEAENVEPLPTLDNSSVAVWRTKVDLVREARIQFGAARARLLWERLGLPEVPALPPALTPGEIDGRAALTALLDHAHGGHSVATLIADARAGDAGAAAVLLRFGVAIGAMGIWIANTAPLVNDLFDRTPLRGSGWVRALRSLPGVTAGERQTFAGHQSRSTFVPLDLLP